MIEVITGTDWSSSKNGKINTNNLKIINPYDGDDSKDDNSKDDNSSQDGSGKQNELSINPYNYFEIYSSLFGNSDSISPINLGLYLDRDLNIHSTQFVGIMPLTNIRELKPLKNNDEQYVIKIDSRFHISPSMMLKEVLEGDDYYENPGMLQCNAYKLSELKELFGRNKKNKVLCGTIKDIGKIALKQSDTGKSNSDKLDSFLSSVYPIFEVIRFVNFAKEVCKKSLKQQSVYKEENLVGRVKGRILVNKQIKQNLSRGQYHKTYCAYNSLSDSIKENIILKYTLHLCSKLEIADSLREDIMFCNRVLANVPLKKCNISDFVGLKSNGAFRQYKQAMDAAKEIIRRYYISYDQSSDNRENAKEGTIQVADYSVDPYFIDMNLLFEYYCRALFRKAINKYNHNTGNDYVIEMEAATEGNKQLFEDGSSVKSFYMPTYIPDIMIKYRKKDEQEYKVLTVIDAKYSDVEHSGEKRARTHQVLFYMNVLDSDYGGLISPRLELKNEGANNDTENGYFIDNYLYDANEKNKSRQKLCYLPLNEKTPVNGNTYDHIIFTYLEEIMQEKISEDKKKQDQLDLKEKIKK